MRLLTNILFILSTASLVVIVAVPAFADTCPTNTNALIWWYVGCDGEHSCSAEAEAKVTWALAQWNNVGQWGWSDLYELYELVQTNTPLLRISTNSGAGLEQNLPNRGHVLLYTHGLAGAADLEYYAVPDSADSAAHRYVWRDGWAASDLALGPKSGTVVVRPSGIQNHFRTTDQNALLHLAYCQSFGPDDVGRDAWLGAAKLGYYDSPAYSDVCDDIKTIYNRLGCGDWPFRGHQLDDAMRGINSSLSCSGGWGIQVYPCGSKWQLVCGHGCEAVSSSFIAVGGFSSTAWALAALAHSRSIELRGFSSRDLSKDKGKTLGSVSCEGNVGVGIYRIEDVPLHEYPYYRFVETDMMGRRQFSVDFTPGSEPDWQGLLRQVESYQAVEKGQSESSDKIATKISERFPVSESSCWPYVACFPVSVIVYGSADSLVFEMASDLQERGINAIPIVGDGTATNAASYAEYFADCNVHCGAPLPTLALVGRESETLTLPYFDGGGDCAGFPCQDFSAFADFAGDELEDIPIYWLPANTISKIDENHTAALLYENQIQEFPRAVLFYGDRTDSVGGETEVYDSAVEAMGSIKNALIRNAYSIRELYAHNYSPNDVVSRQNDFVSLLSSGVSLVTGLGGWTESSRWPGYFEAGNWQSDPMTDQGIVALVGGCLIGNVGYPSPLRQGLWAADGTRIAFATGFLTASWDYRHEEWMTYLGEEMEQAGIGEWWPTIVFNAKKRALAENPHMLNYLRGVCSFGNMVRSIGGSPTGIGDIAGPKQADLSVSILGSPGSRVSVTIQSSVERTASVDLFDLPGRFVGSVFEGPMKAGTQTFSLDPRVLGRHIGSGVYFLRIRSAGREVVRKFVLIR